MDAWEIQVSNNRYFAVFSAKISAGADVFALKDTIQFVMESADEMEVELTGMDEF